MMPKTYPPSPLKPASGSSEHDKTAPVSAPVSAATAMEAPPRNLISCVSTSSAIKTTMKHVIDAERKFSTSAPASPMNHRAVRTEVAAARSTASAESTPKMRRRKSKPESMDWTSTLYARSNVVLIGSPVAKSKSWRRARSATTVGAPSSWSAPPLLPGGTPTATLPRKRSWPARPASIAGPAVAELSAPSPPPSAYSGNKLKPHNSKEERKEELPPLTSASVSAAAEDAGQMLGLPGLKKKSVAVVSTTMHNPLGSRTSSPSSFST